MAVLKNAKWLVLLSGLMFPLSAMAADEGGGTVLLGGIVVGLVAVVGAVAFARPLGLTLAAVAGAGVSLFLAYEHTQVGKAACDISSAISCSAVLGSDASKLFGVPVALFGFGYFLGMSWLAFRYLTVKKSGALLLMQVGGVVAVGFDVYLGWQMSQIGALCPFCAATYVLNLCLLVGATMARSADTSGEPVNLVSALASEGGTATVMGMVGLVVGIMGFGGEGSTSSAVKSEGGPLTASELGSMYEQVAGQIRLDPNDPMKGAADAKYTVVEWADFQCPHCAASFPGLKKVAEENADVKIYYKNYPISNVCNRFVEWEGHADACRAAAAGICANSQSSFWPLAEKMFKNQQYLGKEDIRFMAEQLKLDMTAFEACMQDPATEAAVKEDVEGGGLAQIHGTPSIFLKGAFGDQWVRINGGGEELEAILKVARAGGQLPAPAAPSGN